METRSKLMNKLHLLLRAIRLAGYKRAKSEYDYRLNLKYENRNTKVNVIINGI